MAPPFVTESEEEADVLEEMEDSVAGNDAGKLDSKVGISPGAVAEEEEELEVLVQLNCDFSSGCDNSSFHCNSFVCFVTLGICSVKFLVKSRHHLQKKSQSLTSSIFSLPQQERVGLSTQNVVTHSFLNWA